MLKKILNRKASLPTILSELLTNIIICWVVYGICSWESNPFKWDIITQVFALFFVCVYCPYKDARRAILKEEQEQQK